MSQEEIKRALEAYKVGNFRLAERLFEQLENNGNLDSQLRVFLGISKIQQGKVQQAILVLREALQDRPKDIALLSLLGKLLTKFNNEEAVEIWDRLYQLDPQNIDAAYELANSYYRQYKLEKASILYEQTLEKEPSLTVARNNLGNIYVTQGRFEEGCIEFKKILEENPENTAVMLNLSKSLCYAHRFKEAQQLLQTLLDIQPQSAYAHVQYAFSLLWDGQYKLGWEEYEWRWRVPEFTEQNRKFNAPNWGGESLIGKTILLYGEQGYGDMFQFVRFVTKVSEKAEHVFLECKSELYDLFKTIKGVGTCIKAGEVIPRTDYVAPLMSLSHLCKIELEDLPGAIPYLGEGLCERVYNEGNEEDIRVGIVFASKSGHLGNPSRMFNVKNYHNLLQVHGVSYYRLNVDEMNIEEKAVLKEDIYDIGPSFDTFKDTAEAILGLDLVISVDTGVAHLAGALGKPVWLLLNKGGDWRWLSERTDSPWYPTMKIFSIEGMEENAMFCDLKTELETYVRMKV